MKKKLLLCLALCYSVGGVFALSLQDALTQKLVEVVSISGREYTAHTLKVTLRNKTNNNLTLEIPLGQMFAPIDTNEQTMLVVHAEVLALAKGQTASKLLSTYCCSAHKSSPLTTSPFAVASLASSKMLEMLSKAATFELSSNDLQSAVWAISDGFRAEAITEPELRQSTADLLGQTLQDLTLQYETAVIPGRIAFEPTGLHVEGNFRYYTPRNIQAQLALYTTGGKLITVMHRNLSHSKGQHKFHFKFKFNGVKPGSYVVKLTSGNKVISEMPVQF